MSSPAKEKKQRCIQGQIPLKPAEPEHQDSLGANRQAGINLPKLLCCPGFTAQNNRCLPREISYFQKAPERIFPTNGRFPVQQGKHNQQECFLQRNSVSPASRHTFTCLEAPETSSKWLAKEYKERERKKKERKKPIDIYHWHNLSLNYTSKFGSLELNLHFKHDFKNTPLCFPPKGNTRLL